MSHATWRRHCGSQLPCGMAGDGSDARHPVFRMWPAAGNNTLALKKTVLKFPVRRSRFEMCHERLRLTPDSHASHISGRLRACRPRLALSWAGWICATCVVAGFAATSARGCPAHRFGYTDLHQKGVLNDHHQ